MSNILPLTHRKSADSSPAADRQIPESSAAASKKEKYFLNLSNLIKNPDSISRLSFSKDSKIPIFSKVPNPSPSIDPQSDSESEDPVEDPAANRFSTDLQSDSESEAPAVKGPLLKRILGKREWIEIGDLETTYVPESSSVPRFKFFIPGKKPHVQNQAQESKKSSSAANSVLRKKHTSKQLDVSPKESQGSNNTVAATSSAARPVLIKRSVLNPTAPPLLTLTQAADLVEESSRENLSSSQPKPKKAAKPVPKSSIRTRSAAAEVLRQRFPGRPSTLRHRPISFTVGAQ